MLRLSVASLIVVDHLRRRFACFKLCAHLSALPAVYDETSNVIETREHASASEAISEATDAISLANVFMI